MAREINLVPDIKGEMLKTLKLRNLIFFICIMVTVVSIGVVGITALIMGGQQAALDSKQSTLDLLSSKLNSYSDLDDFLTIKNQVDDIDALSNNKKVLSRTFNILSAMIPTGADTITISELDVDLTGERPVLTFDAQANAGKEPYIDYNVLDSFKKSMQFMYYDYGNYVDKDGNMIPAYCMIESGQDGATFTDTEKGIYALWTVDAEGCSESTDGYSTEDYEGQRVVKIWRTPQMDEWYKAKPTTDQPYMSLEGEISGVAHFESQCIKYVGDLSGGSNTPKWVENKTCMLVPEGTNGIEVSESSNGRDTGDELVLRFSAAVELDANVYKFANAHMLAIPPSGRRNVTDSYVQVQAMFGERARDCDKDDTACAESANEKGDN